MALATEESFRVVTASHWWSRILRALLALTMMALSASCFLKYMWWTACYSAWNGIPKLAQQWRDAGVRASLNGWGFILLQAAVIVILTSMIKMRRFSGVLSYAMRIGASLLITVPFTAAFALFLGWTQIGTR